jgi:hypothetical protein
MQGNGADGIRTNTQLEAFGDLDQPRLMSVKTARKLAGPDFADLSDEEVEIQIKIITLVAKKVIADIIQKSPKVQ